MRPSSSRPVVLLLFAVACGGSDDDPSQAEEVCAPPHGSGSDPCVEIGASDPLRIATLLDNTTTIAESGAAAVAPSIGIDDRRGVEVARTLRPKALGHTVELVGSGQMNVGSSAAPRMVANYRENCNNLDATLTKNEDVAKAIVDDGKVLAVIGPICSNSGAQIERVFTAGKLLVVSPNNQSPSLTAVCPEPQTTPATPCRPADSFYFRTAANGQFQGGVVADHARSKAYATAVTIDDGSLFSHGVATSFAALFNGTTTNRSPVTTAEQMDAALTALAAAPPAIVYMTNTSLAQTRIFVKKARDGVAPDLPAGTAIMVSNAVQSKAFWEPDQGGIGTAANGVLTSSLNMSFTSSSGYAAFVTAYKTVSGGEAPINLFHAFAFDAYDLTLDAIEKVAIKKGDGWLIPRAALRAAVLETSRKGLTSVGDGKLACATGDCTPGQTAFVVDEIKCPPASGSGTCNMSLQPLP